MKMFRLLTFVFAALIFSPYAFGQEEEIKKIIIKGIELHDQGNFSEAIAMYEKVLEIDQNSSLAHYEMALSYLSAKDYAKAEKHSKKVIELDKGNTLEAYVALGNAQDLLGKPDKALKSYEKGMKKFDHYLLYYNHAIACLNKGKIDKAYDSAIKAINNNSGHASSHLILSKIMDQKNSRIQAMLPLYFFLMIEPNSNRAGTEYDVLRGYLNRGVSKESENQINVLLSIDDESEFSAAEMMISLVKSSENLEENKGKTDLELFAQQNDKIFKILGELKKDNQGFWWDFYVTFFYDLAKSSHTKPYSYFISLSKGEEASDWLVAHEAELKGLSDWVNN